MFNVESTENSNTRIMVLSALIVHQPLLLLKVTEPINSWQNVYESYLSRHVLRPRLATIFVYSVFAVIRSVLIYLRSSKMRGALATRCDFP